jgi:DNA polymerase-1
MKTIKKNHYYLIDGSGYIFRAYYALPPLSRKSDGLPTGAVSGFCSMLFKLLEDVKKGEGKFKPTHFAVIFDSARKNFRNDIFKEYKANRAEAPDDLVPQFEYIRKAVEAFSLPSIEMQNYEADDLIATYTKKALERGDTVTIVSSDKDLMQLLQKGVRLYDPIKNKELGEKEVLDKFGVKPEQVIDVQSLAGDSTDNIPGVPGIGVKTAAELINKYKNLDNLLKNAHQIKQNKRRQTLEENKDKALISRELVRLKNDINLNDDLSSFILKDLDKNKLYEFLREMEFNRLLSQVISYYGEPSKSNTTIIEDKSKITLKNNYKSITKKNLFHEFIKKLNKQKVIAFDTETTSINPLQAELVGISLCSDVSEAFYLPFKHKNSENLDLKETLKEIKTILEDPSKIIVGQNIKYDMLILDKYGIQIANPHDTMLMSYTLDAGLNRHNMDTLAEIHLNHKCISYKEITGTGKSKINFDEVDLKTATNYAAEDAQVTLALYNYFLKRLEKEKIKEIYENFEKPMLQILCAMEKKGIKVDEQQLKKLSSLFQKRIENLQKQIYKIANKEFNIASTKQLGEIIYNELKISKHKKTKKGSLATNSNILEDLAYAGHDFPKLVIEWRQLTKLKSTYTEALQEHINPKTKRVHTSFLLAATNTGRLASSDPNLQNIPIKTNEGKEIRKAFVADKANCLISADYSQIEMRILADLADVKELKKAFKNNDDIHSMTASEVFNCSLKQVDEEMRRKAKAINFGIIYGITQYGLAKQLSVSNSEALEFIESYFKKFPEIKSYMNATIKTCRKNGYVSNIFGRKIHLRGINDKNFSVRSFQERAAINAPIQSSAADIIRIAMINIFNNKKIKLDESKMLLQIHDELVFESTQDNIKQHIEQIKHSMESAGSSQFHKFSIPLKVNVNYGSNWDDAH